MLAGMSTDQVAEIYPAAPPVSDLDLQAAADWVEGEAELSGLPLPTRNTRQERELKRAIAAYALYLTTGGGAASGRASAAAQASATKAFTIGPIKIERTTADVESVAGSLATSASEWLAIAGLHLAGAGLVGGWAFPGAAR